MKDKFEIFVCRDFDAKHPDNKKNKEHLIKKAAVAFGVPEDIAEKTQILRTDMGKPYFNDLDVHFSISHSQDIWACLMGPDCCGLDIQYIKPCNYKRIAKRFFSLWENAYIEQNDIEGFFDIWTRKEAYGKYTGEGFFGDCPNLVSTKGELLSQISETVFLKEIDMGSKIKGVICFDKPNIDIEIREEW